MARDFAAAVKKKEKESKASGVRDYRSSLQTRSQAPPEPEPGQSLPKMGLAGGLLQDAASRLSQTAQQKRDSLPSMGSAGRLLQDSQSRLAANAAPSIGPVQTSLPSPGTAGTLLQNTQRRLAANAPVQQPEPELPGRDIPIVGPVLRGLDKLADVTKPASDIAQQLYVPGAGIGNIGSFAASIESGLARVAPRLALSTNLGARVATGAIKEAVTGAPIGAGATLANNPNATGKDIAAGAVSGFGLGSLTGAGMPIVSKALSPVFTKALDRLAARRSSVAPETETAINNALNRKTGVAYGTLRPASNETYINKVMSDIKPIVSERMTPPLENPNELAKWIKPHLGDDVSLNEVRKLPYEDMRQLAEEVRKNLSTYDMAKTAAKERGYDLDQLLNNQTPSLKQTAERLRMGRVAGAIEPPKVNVRIATGRTGITPLSAEVPKMESQPLPRLSAAKPAEQPSISQSAEPDVIQASPEPRVRDRVYAKLDEMEQAARKRLDAKKGRLSANPLGEWFDHGVIMAAKTGKGTIKAANFTEELVKEFGESIRPHAAAILRQTREILRAQERAASQEGLAADAFNNSGIGDAASFESKITRGKRAEKRSFEDKVERLKTQFTEDVAPINRLERNVTGGIASAENSIYKSARLFKGVPEKINQFIDRRLKPIVRTIEKAGYHSDDLGRYALAVHARDVNAAGYKSGFTNAEIDDVINKLGTPEMEAARKQLVQINRDLLNDLVDSGVVSGQLRDVLNDRWKNYIPLFRDVDDVVGRSSGLSEALANVANPIKKLKGSEANVIEPLENMVSNIAKNINASERNKVASHITRLSKLDTENKYIRKLDEGEKIQGKSVVSVKENGENVHYEVEKDVYDALLTLDKESSIALIRFLSKPASWLRAGATLTPEFMIRNPIRDYRNARIISESGFGLGDYAVGLASSFMGKFGKGKLYQDWVENLGAYGNIVSEDRKVFAAAQRKVLTQSPTQKFVNIVNPKSFIALLRGISDISESSTKVGEYRAALRKGATKQEAAYRARDIMDFARAGASIRQTNKIIAFLNANIQGKSKTIRAFKKNPIRTSVRVFQHMAVPTVGIHYYNKYFANDTQKDTIQNAPDWQKNTFWLVAIPGTDMVARIPKPFDFAVVANVIDKSLDFFAEKDKEAFDGFAQGLFADNALPMMITGLQPIFEGVANYSIFRQGPVIPQRDAGLLFEDQYDPVKTSETAKAVAKGVDSTFGKMAGNFRSPYVIDNTIQGLFAGGGKYVTDAVDAILGKTGVVDRPVAPAKRVEQKPVLRSFLVDPLQSGKAMDKLYNRKEDLSREKLSASRNDTKFDSAKSKELKGLEKTADKLSKISKDIRTIEADKTLTAKQKREQIEVLLKQRNDLVGSTK